MDNAVVVKVGDGGESGSDEVRGVRLVVGAFPADAIEELAAECEVGYEVYCDTGQASHCDEHTKDRAHGCS